MSKNNDIYERIANNINEHLGHLCKIKAQTEKSALLLEIDDFKIIFNENGDVIGMNRL